MNNDENLRNVIRDISVEHEIELNGKKLMIVYTDDIAI